jgi:GAF domain
MPDASGETFARDSLQLTLSGRGIGGLSGADLQQNGPIRETHHTVSHAGAAMRFPGEDGGRSLGDMAQRDLDAALQLLADRAQYITGASGAAIALRRSGMNDMLCRASTGSNAPELGALLSTEFGLSGESVRTRKALRCDDAERDARVNREVCRQLGIASVVVMPVVHDDEVLGVFELFSGQAHAFGDRDISAVKRLSEMVETAVRMADATASLPARLGTSQTHAMDTGVDEETILDVEVENSANEIPAGIPVRRDVAASNPQTILKDPVPAIATKASTEAPITKRAEPVTEAAIPKKPLFWSAAASASESPASPVVDQSHVPPVLRGLRKCEACGFPISPGRVLCVECEEKKWRGQLRRP